MRLSTRSRYGVRAIFDIAYHSLGMPAMIKDISRRQQISPRYLEQIFQRLKKARILGSKRGPRGGYYLLKKPEEVSIGDIIRAAEGPIEIVFCVAEHPRKPCSRRKDCVASAMWKEVDHKLAEFFDSISVQDLCRRAKAAGVEPETAQSFHYEI